MNRTTHSPTAALRFSTWLTLAHRAQTHAIRHERKERLALQSKLTKRGGR